GAPGGTAGADQVVGAQAAHAAGDVVVRGAAAFEVAFGVAGHDGVVQQRGRGRGEEKAAAAGDAGVIAVGKVEGDGRVQREERPEAEDAAAAISGPVAADGAVPHGERAAVVDAAAETAGPVAMDGTVLHDERAAVVDAAADRGLITADSAVFQRQRAGVGVVNAAAEGGGCVAGDRAVPHRQVFAVEDAAAEGR